MKPIKWSLKYIKWLSPIKVVTSDDFGVILWVTSNWEILKWNLSDHLISLLKWKYEVWAFFWWVGRPHKRMERDFNDLITFGFKRNDFWSFLWYFMKSFHQFIQKWREHTWGRPTRQKKAQTPYFYLSKRIKWSLKFHLSIFQYGVTHEMTPKSWKVKTSIYNNHWIYLSDHLSGFLKWKYELKAF